MLLARREIDVAQRSDLEPLQVLEELVEPLFSLLASAAFLFSSLELLVFLVRQDLLLVELLQQGVVASLLRSSVGGCPGQREDATTQTS